MFPTLSGLHPVIESPYSALQSWVVWCCGECKNSLPGSGYSSCPEQNKDPFI